MLKHVLLFCDNQPSYHYFYKHFGGNINEHKNVNVLMIYDKHDDEIFDLSNIPKLNYKYSKYFGHNWCSIINGKQYDIKMEVCLDNPINIVNDDSLKLTVLELLTTATFVKNQLIHILLDSPSNRGVADKIIIVRKVGITIYDVDDFYHENLSSFDIILDMRINQYTPFDIVATLNKKVKQLEKEIKLMIHYMPDIGDGFKEAKESFNNGLNIKNEK